MLESAVALRNRELCRMLGSDHPQTGARRIVGWHRLGSSGVPLVRLKLVPRSRRWTNGAARAGVALAFGVECADSRPICPRFGWVWAEPPWVPGGSSWYPLGCLGGIVAACQPSRWAAKALLFPRTGRSVPADANTDWKASYVRSEDPNCPSFQLARAISDGCARCRWTSVSDSSSESRGECTPTQKHQL